MTETVLERLERQLGEIRGMLEGGAGLPLAVSYEGAAQRLSVSPKTIQRMVRLGQLVTVIIGGKKKIPTSELHRVATPVLPRGVRPAPSMKADGRSTRQKIRELRLAKRR